MPGCGGGAPPTPPPASKDSVAAPPLVDVAEVRTERIAEDVEVAGTLDPNEKALLKPEIVGRIKKIHKEEGQAVEAGELVVELDDEKARQELAVAEARLLLARQNVLEQRQRLKTADAQIARTREAIEQAGQNVRELQARLERADAVLERARQDEARTRTLFEKEFKTQDDLERSITAVKQAEADRAAALAALGGVSRRAGSVNEVHTHSLVAQAKAAWEAEEAQRRQILVSLGAAAAETSSTDAHPEVQRAVAEFALAKEKLKDYRILAPMNGVLSARRVAPGDYVDKGALLFELVDVSSVKTAFQVPERILGRVKIGQQAQLRVASYPDQVFGGVVYYIDPTLDEKTRTVLMKMRIANAGRKLKPGMFANVRLAVAEHAAAIVIPEVAVVPQGGKFLVFVVETGVARRREIEVGLRTPGRVQVLSGLVPGEIVVVGGIQKIRDGSAVQILNETMKQ